MEFLQSLSMTASNERWLALERLLESPDAKANLLEGEKTSSKWANYPLLQEIVEMTLKNRKNVSDDIDETLFSAMEEKYR